MTAPYRHETAAAFAEFCSQVSIRVLYQTVVVKFILVLSGFCLGSLRWDFLCCVVPLRLFVATLLRVVNRNWEPKYVKSCYIYIYIYIYMLCYIAMAYSHYLSLCGSVGGCMWNMYRSYS